MATPIRFTPESHANENTSPAGSRCKTGQRLMTGLYDNLNAQLALEGGCVLLNKSPRRKVAAHY